MPKRGEIRNPVERFFAKVKKTDGCWLWAGAVDKDGYGKFQLTISGTRKQKHVRAHRYSFFLANGRWPDEHALHSCDTPACVNPLHLEDADQSKNISDCVTRDRHARHAHVGEKNPRSRLTNDVVVQLRTRHAAGESVSALARETGIPRPTIDGVIRRRTWRHL